jgi:hypothetical protein
MTALVLESLAALPAQALAIPSFFEIKESAGV